MQLRVAKRHTPFGNVTGMQLLKKERMDKEKNENIFKSENILIALRISKF